MKKIEKESQVLALFDTSPLHQFSVLKIQQFSLAMLIFRQKYL